MFIKLNIEKNPYNIPVIPKGKHKLDKKCHAGTEM